MALVAAAALLTACSTAGRAGTTGAHTLPDPDGLAVAPLTASWSARVGTIQGLAVASDGSVVAGASSDGAGGVLPWAYTAAGRTIPLSGALGSEVFALPAGRVAVGPGVADAGSPTMLFARTGGLLWSTPTVGPVTVTANPSGSRLVVLDAGAGSGVEAVVGSRRVQAVAAPVLAATGADVRTSLDAAGQVLVVNSRGATMIASDGATLWHLGLDLASVRYSVRLDPSGSTLIAATAGEAPALYGFSTKDGRVRAQWSEALPPGGRNQVVAVADGRVLLAGVGNAATIAVYRTSDGAGLWQDVLPTVAGVTAPTITGAAMAAGGQVVVAARSCLADGQSCLLFLKPDGRPAAMVPLATASQIALAADGTAAAVASAEGHGVERLAWFDLSPALPAPAKASTVSSAPSP